MPRLSSSSVPKYSHHKASGQSVVTIQGRDHYLGSYGSRVSKAKYNQLVGEWVAAGRPAMPTPAPDALTIVEVIQAYWKVAERHYVKDGAATSEQDCIRAALRPVRRLYENAPAVEFGPLALKAVRQAMIDAGLSRKSINEHSGKIRRMFKWAVSEELLPATVYHALTTVAGLQKGRTTAKETKPVPPVETKTVDATLSHLPAIVADIVRFQRLTGCRPGEVCLIRPRDVDRTGDIWNYKPASHKTEHHGKSRVNLSPFASGPIPSNTFLSCDKSWSKEGLNINSNLSLRRVRSPWGPPLPVIWCSKGCRNPVAVVPP